jgi:hypothetical protein
MHVLLEGVNKLCIKLLLHRFIFVDHLFNLADLNTAILNFGYSTNDALDKPKTIEESELQSDGSLVQSAAAMSVLTTLLPFMIGQFVTEGNERWINFIRLHQINMLCFSPNVSHKTVASLRALVATHNKAFVELYPDCSFIPKLHYLTHLPDQMQHFGPLRHHSCMRFEAKHGFIKN